MAGRSKNKMFDELGYVLRKTGFGSSRKYTALCTICKHELQNTGADRLRRHRNVCAMVDDDGDSISDQNLNDNVEDANRHNCSSSAAVRMEMGTPNSDLMILNNYIDVQTIDLMKNARITNEVDVTLKKEMQKSINDFENENELKSFVHEEDDDWEPLKKKKAKPMDREEVPKSKPRRGKVEHFWTSAETLSLIKHIEAQPELWDTSRKEYSNKYLKHKLTADIAATLNLSVNDVVGKWRSLRTCFGAQVRKEKNRNGRSGVADSYVSKWEFFAPLQFTLINDASTLDLNDDEEIIENNLSTTNSVCIEEVIVDTVTDTLKHKRPSNFERKSITQQEDPFIDAHSNTTMLIKSRERDESATFGECIANALRKITDPAIASWIKHEINNIIYAGEQKQLANRKSASSSVWSVLPIAECKIEEPFDAA